MFEGYDIKFKATSHDPLSLGIPSAVEVNSYQLAVQLCLELLGSRVNTIPVVLSVTSSPQTISAVLRSGAQPFLIDIESSLQMSTANLVEVLTETDGQAVVLLDTPGGMTPHPSLLKTIEGLPVVWATQHHSVPKGDFKADFTVLDLDQVCGGGGLILSSWKEQVNELKLLRSGELGHSGEMSFYQKSALVENKHLLDDTRERVVGKSACDLYNELLREAGHTESVLLSGHRAYYSAQLVKVPDASKCVAHLHSYGIEAKRASYPLYHLSQLKERWMSNPSYPTAHDLDNRVLALPCHANITHHNVEVTVEQLLEVF